MSIFQDRDPSVEGNTKLRTPQREVFRSIADFAANASAEREVGIILPVGCGKSGCITLAPFAMRSARTLVVAPGVPIATQLESDFDPSNADMFYRKSGALTTAPYPEPAAIRGRTSNRADLDEADVIITNIGQLQGAENRWLQNLPEDFFDLILFDEGHHNVANSWAVLRAKFPEAKIINFSATPLRADGQLMAGRVLYSYPVARAIQEGYVKHLKAVVLNPRTLKYVRRTDGAEIEVTLDEVRRLGEEDADFRRSIVTSDETLTTIVDASIRELEKLRKAAGDTRLKIIASALNFEHCRQIVEAYRGRNLRADYVHSREDSAANTRVMARLQNHELDVIVQVRKLGEGFDHPHLAVAVVLNVFSNLSPFVQFVGRIMRVIKQDAPADPLNQGVVVFHAGANIARRWEDFQSYSAADQEYFDQLLPMEGLDFSDAQELEVDPSIGIDRPQNPVDVMAQGPVVLQEIPLLSEDTEAIAALRLLKDRGYTTDQIRVAYEELEPVPATKLKQRQAKQRSLAMRVKTEAARILKIRGINPEGRDLDRKRLGRTNLIVMSSAIDRRVNALVGHSTRERHEFTRDELDQVDAAFGQLLDAATQEVLDGET